MHEICYQIAIPRILATHQLLRNETPQPTLRCFSNRSATPTPPLNSGTRIARIKPIPDRTGLDSPLTETNDPRIYFAAERTLLAWVRTGLTVLGLGFVVARFGLFLRMIRPQSEPPQVLTTSVVIGVGLILFGAAAMAIAGVQHLRFWRTLGPTARPTSHSATWAVVFSLLLAFCGMVLAGYLLRGAAMPE